jgi:hypothetical protein
MDSQLMRPLSWLAYELRWSASLLPGGPPVHTLTHAGLPLRIYNWDHAVGALPTSVRGGAETGSWGG